MKVARTKRLLLSLLTLVTVMAINISCSNGSEGDNINSVVEKCWTYAKQNPDGFTIDIRTFEVPSNGIVVSYAATQNSFDKKDLPKVIEHAYSHANLVGGWYNEENKQYYFDSDTIFEESMLKEALEWGKQNGQHSVFILSEMRNVDITY